MNALWNAPISDRFSSLCARVFSPVAAILESEKILGTRLRNKQSLVKTNFGWYSYFLGHAKEDCSIIAPRDTHCPHCRHLSLRLIKRKLLLRSIHSIDETLHQFLFIYTVIIANRQVPTRTRRLTFFGSNFNLPNFHIWPLRYYNYC